MTCYIVTFEIARQDQRKAMEEALKSYGSFCPINETTWAILSDKKAAEVRDHLMALIQTTDKIFVVRSGTEAAWRNAYAQANADWLKKYL